MQYLYAAWQTLKPCPAYEDQFMTTIKELWCLHVGRQPAEVLTAGDLGTLDAVLARPRITRCKVWYKPYDEGAKRRRIHDSCQEHTFHCNRDQGWLSRKLSGPGADERPSWLGAEGRD